MLLLFSFQHAICEWMCINLRAKQVELTTITTEPEGQEHNREKERRIMMIICCEDLMIGMANIRRKQEFHQICSILGHQHLEKRKILL